jgi:hypothetical protein
MNTRERHSVLRSTTGRFRVVILARHMTEVVARRRRSDRLFQDDLAVVDNGHRGARRARHVQRFE